MFSKLVLTEATTKLQMFFFKILHYVIAISQKDMAGNHYMPKILHGPTINFAGGTIYLWISQLFLHAPILSCKKL